jgi:hypothetical protein
LGSNFLQLLTSTFVFKAWDVHEGGIQTDRHSLCILCGRYAYECIRKLPRKQLVFERLWLQRQRDVRTSAAEPIVYPIADSIRNERSREAVFGRE